MRHFRNPEHLAEQELTDQLRSSGTEKKKGEEALYNKYAYLIHSEAGKYALPKEVLCDIYSDTILAVTLSITRGLFQERSSLKTYVFNIFHNKAVDVLRKKTSRKNSVHHNLDMGDMHLFMPDDAPTVLEKLIAKSEVETFKRKLQVLPYRGQQLLMLAAEGFTDGEIATIMHFKNRNVAKTSRLRCIRMLRHNNTACETA